MGDVTVNENLDVTSINGDVKQSEDSTIIVKGDTTLEANNGYIKLDNNKNNFEGTVTSNAGYGVVISDGGKVWEKTNSRIKYIIESIQRVEKNFQTETINVVNLDNVIKDFSKIKLNNNNLEYTGISSSIGLIPTQLDTSIITSEELNKMKINQIALQDNSILSVVDNGVKLPEGLTQEYYLNKK